MLEIFLTATILGRVWRWRWVEVERWLGGGALSLKKDSLLTSNSPYQIQVWAREHGNGLSSIMHPQPPHVLSVQSRKSASSGALGNLEKAPSFSGRGWASLPSY